MSARGWEYLLYLYFAVVIIIIALCANYISDLDKKHKIYIQELERSCNELS